MIKSMTGFGRAKYDIDGRQYIVEIKSVNNRYCDISVKIPRNISYLEEKVKAFKIEDFKALLEYLYSPEFKYSHRDEYLIG